MLSKTSDFWETLRRYIFEYTKYLTKMHLQIIFDCDLKASVDVFQNFKGVVCLYKGQYSYFIVKFGLHPMPSISIICLENPYVTF